MKRQLIHEDKELFVRIKSDLKHFFPYLDNIKKTYEDLEMGAFTAEAMKTITSGKIRSIESSYSAKVESELDKTGITIQAIRDNLIIETQKKVGLFKKAVSDAASYTAPQYGMDRRYSLKFYEIGYSDRSESFIVDPTAAESIMESECRVYLDSTEELDLYNALNDLISAQDKVRKLLSKTNYVFGREGFELQEIQRVFIRYSGTSPATIHPRSIKYALQQQQRRDNVKRMLRK